MKQKIIILLSTALVLATFGCEEFLNSLIGSTPLSISQRIDEFETDINSEARTADAILENFAPVGEMEDRENAGVIEYWDAIFAPGYTFDFEVTDYSNPDEVQVTVIQTYNGTDYPEEYWVFVMYKDSTDNYFIKQIWDDFSDQDAGWLLKQIF